MTTNQAIDGVPREAVAALEKARDVLRAIIRDKAAGVHYASAQAACHQINGALLDALAKQAARPIKLPERKSAVDTFSTYGLGECAGWNKCLDALGDAFVGE